MEGKVGIGGRLGPLFFEASSEDGGDIAWHAGRGHFIDCRVRAPFSRNGLFNLLRWGVDRSKKHAMRSVCTVIRLSPWLFQVSRDEIDRHAVQNGALEEQGMPFPSLRIARDFHVADHQIADAPDGDGRLPPMERRGDPFEDESIRVVDVREVGMQIERKYERIREASRSLQHGAPAARPPKDRDAVLFACREMRVFGQAAGRAQNHKMEIAFPKTEQRITSLLVQFVQQRFIQGQILGRRWEGQIEQPERAHVRTASR